MPEEKVRFAGIPVYMDGREWIVPPLSVGQFKLYGKNLMIPGTVDAENFTERLDDVLPVIHLALARNYPDLKKEELENMLDLGTFKEVIEAIANASGAKRISSGGAVPVVER